LAAKARLMRSRWSRVPPVLRFP